MLQTTAIAPFLPNPQQWIPLTVLLIGLSRLGWGGDRATAQVIPDGTLGPESSQVVINGVTVEDAAADLIRAGARRGENLFHSFDQFSIGEGQRVYFENLAGIERVISRVTGNLQSDIFGTLGSLGSADVYLLNPNGIVFGPNARLDVGGSFIASTADAFEFADLGTFSARNPAAPSPLLTIQPSALTFGQSVGSLPPGAIVSRSAADEVGLQVPTGENLVLLGGDVVVDGGRLNAPGGRIEVGAAAGAGAVALEPDGRLTFPEGLARGAIIFENGALVDVRAADGGDIGLTARSIDILGFDSALLAGIAEGLGSATSQAGDIVLNATEYIRLSGGAIFNDIDPNATGTGGNIDITTPMLEVVGGAQLSAATFGEGDAGNIIITASDRVTFAGENENGARSNAFSDVPPGGIGAGGNIEITTSVLEMLDGAQLFAVTFGEGDAGNIIITASDRVTFAGTTKDGFPGGAFSDIAPGGIGTGGSISITTPVLEALDGALIASATSGRGDAGSIIITASDRVTFAGTTEDERFRSGAFSSVTLSGIGAGGSINITTPVLEVLDGARMSVSTSGEGNVGSIIITASDRVTFAGESKDRLVSSSAFSAVFEGGIGSGGSITISAPVLEVLNGAQLVSTTSGEGDAGSIIIAASDRVTFAGTAENELFPSGAFSSVTESGIGTGGDIDITTSRLEVLDGAVLTSRTQGAGDAGDIGIRASDRVTLRGSAIGANSDSATGQGGDIDITANLLTLTDQANILTRTVSTDGGNITITQNNLLALINNSTISTEAGTEGAGGDGGDITINTRFIAATLSGNSDIVANAFEGSGGTIRITASGGIFGIVPQPERTSQSDITASSELGVDGTIDIQSPEIDPGQATIELPSAFVASEVVRSCRETFAQSRSEFIVSGRGGLPQSPLTPLTTATLWQDVLPMETGDLARHASSGRGDRPSSSGEALQTPHHQASATPAITEAKGWVRDQRGVVRLVATPQPRRPALFSPTCRATNPTSSAR